ncbi:MAG TPA: hypothetical protein VET51_13225 [Burkholderiales bacterium]|nr:hypothetical protein [Burkholderiales bacterium]
MFNVVVEWLDDGKSRARFALPGRQEWNAQHISDLIQVLAQIREEMTPAVPEEPPRPHEPLHAPRYKIELDQFSGGTLFEFRHPSLGWLEFVVPSAERSRISRFLAEQESAWEQFRQR